MIAWGAAHISVAGILAAIIIAGSVGSTLYWMLTPPASYVQKIAKKAETELAEMVGSLIVAFSPEIDSSHMVALAVKLARGEKSEVLALYIIEVPYTLPPDATMPAEERIALDVLGAAETIANKNNVAIRTETIKTRSTKQAVLDVAKREQANLIMLGSFREGKYTGAPLSRIIEEITADAKCDVLIGVEGKHGTLLLSDESVQSNPQPV
ncbi:MAG: universal stress protein [Candidatus Eremiobacteraeota bacterium]|nr:universal stress protein [Candidatus Eremiobacteraeota bacterium]